MSFEIYRPRGERKERQPVVNLSNSSIVLNKNAREKLKDLNNVELAYDRDSHLIRIKSSDEGLMIKKTKIFAKNFYRHFGITKRGRFNAIYIPDDDALYVNLK